jgi:GT2 family glycosyltransferase
MWIDVRIPYELNNQLARAYNRAIWENNDAEWILFLDHDVFLCNPKWYEMCLLAIGQLKNRDPRAACVTCVCGGGRHKRTMLEKGEPSDSIEYHIQESISHYKKYGVQLEQIEIYAAGFFLLLNKIYARAIGGFNQVNSSINNIDADFGNRLLEHGYHIYLMRGLYVYHRRGMKHLRKKFKK